MDDGQQQLPLDAGKRRQVADEGEAEGGPLGWGGGVEEGVAEEGVEGGEGGQLAVGGGVLKQDGELAEELGGCSGTHVECLGGGDRWHVCHHYNHDWVLLESPEEWVVCAGCGWGVD